MAHLGLPKVARGFGRLGAQQKTTVLVHLDIHSVYNLETVKL